MNDHQKHLEKIFFVIAKLGLKVNLSNCSFALSEVRLLRHIVTASGILVDSEKIVAIKDAPVPKSIIELRSLLGLAR